MSLLPLQHQTKNELSTDDYELQPFFVELFVEIEQQNFWSVLLINFLNDKVFASPTRITKVSARPYNEQSSFL
jgi:hypothetical protein